MPRPIYFATFMIANTSQGFYLFKISSKIKFFNIVVNFNLIVQQGENVGESRAWEYYSALIIEVFNSVLGDPRELYFLVKNLSKDLI